MCGKNTPAVDGGWMRPQKRLRVRLFVCVVCTCRRVERRKEKETMEKRLSEFQMSHASRSSTRSLHTQADFTSARAHLENDIVSARRVPHRDQHGAHMIARHATPNTRAREGMVRKAASSTRHGHRLVRPLPLHWGDMVGGGGRRDQPFDSVGFRVELLELEVDVELV